MALLAGDTTMSSAGLANLPAVTSANHCVIVCENEIMYVTAHTASATTATILRGQEGTSAAAHAQNVAWLHGPVASDYDAVLGYAQTTASQGSITNTAVDLTSLTVTVTVPYAQHRIRITGKTYFTSTVADDYAMMIVMQDGVQIDQLEAPLRVIGEGTTIYGGPVIVATAGSHTYKLQGKRQLGSGTLTSNAAAPVPAFILVEDLGPAL